MGGPSGTLVQSCPDGTDPRHFLIIQIKPNRALISRLERKEHVFGHLDFTNGSQVYKKWSRYRFRYVRTYARTYGRTHGLTNMILLTPLHNSPFGAMMLKIVEHQSCFMLFVPSLSRPWPVFQSTSPVVEYCDVSHHERRHESNIG